jgi:hypothetical protein
VRSNQRNENRVLETNLTVRNVKNTIKKEDNDMKKKLSIVVLALVFAVAASAQSTDLAGKWKTIWFQKGVESGTPNMITLESASGGVFGGTYMNDDGVGCPVEGSITTDRKVTIAVKCPKFGITMTGTSSLDNQTISGDYVYTLSTGQFKMERQK